MAQFTYPSTSTSISGVATEAKQDTQITNQGTMITHLSEIEGAVETIEGAISGSEMQVDVVSSALPTGASTSAHQVTQNAHLATIAGDTTSLDAKDFATQTTLAVIAGDTTSLDGKDFATQTTLAAILSDTTSLDAKDFATQTTLASVLSDTNTLAGAISGSEMQVDVVTSALPTGASTAAHQVTQNAHQSQIEDDITLMEARMAGALIPDAHDYIALTYVAAGNGAGEVETAVYKTGGSGGTTVGTLTLAYDSDDKLSSVTKS